MVFMSIQSTDTFCLRFLWFKDNNLNSQICEYHMNVYLFGAVWLFVYRQFWPQSIAETGQEQFC